MNTMSIKTVLQESSSNKNQRTNLKGTLKTEALHYDKDSGSPEYDYEEDGFAPGQKELFPTEVIAPMDGISEALLSRWENRGRAIARKYQGLGQTLRADVEQEIVTALADKHIDVSTLDTDVDDMEEYYDMVMECQSAFAHAFLDEMGMDII